MMRQTARWLLGLPHIEYEDDHILRRAVWVMLALTFFMFVGLTISIDYVVRSNQRLRVQFEYEKSLCTSIQRSRDGLNHVLRRDGQRPLLSVNCDLASRIAP